MPQAPLLAITMGAQAAGTVMQYRAHKSAQGQAEAQAEYEKANTEARVREEQSRNSQNILRAQEQKRKALSQQRAAFVRAGILSDSPSADMVIGELGENLQTRIQDMFVQGQDRVRSVHSQGQARFFSAMNQAKSSSRMATASLISGLGSLSKGAYAAQKEGLFNQG